MIGKYLIKITKESGSLYFVSKVKIMKKDKAIENQMNEEEKKDNRIII